MVDNDFSNLEELNAEREIAIELMKNGDFESAGKLFKKIIQNEIDDWSLYYMLGQCCRLENSITEAIKYLEKAVELNKKEVTVYHALGIAYDLNDQYEKSIESYRNAVETDPDYELTYNSLALTQKKAGYLDKALNNFDVGAKVLASKINKSLINDITNPILKHEDCPVNLWIKYAINSAIVFAGNTNFKMLTIPTAEFAVEEEQTERHGGHYWYDYNDENGKLTRLLLPNYFNTFRSLLFDTIYSDLIGNRGVVFDLLGDHKEAEKHFQEARYFARRI